MKPLKELVELAKKKEKKKVVVACCQDKEVLLAFEKARKLGLVEVILIGDIKTLEEIGKVFGVTRERIRQIEAKAIRKLRHPSRLNQLKNFY